MTELDHLAVELSGTNLIEASAGTGKTYAITCLYLRILLEKELLPEQILVVTYTEAATKELKGRIRKRIKEAIGEIDGITSGDTFLWKLLEAVDSRGTGKRRARQLLERAMNAFDTAAIFTIHGFCLRVLQDNAFESGSRFDAELITDRDSLLRNVVEDFWRIRFFPDNAPLAGYALRSGKKHSIESYLRFAKAVSGNSRTRIIPRYSRKEILSLETGCRDTFTELQAEWRDSREEIAAILGTDNGLSRSEAAYREDLLDGLFSGIDGFICGTNPFDLPDSFSRFCTSGIASLTKKKGTPPSHRFFDLCESLRNLVNERFQALLCELADYCTEQLPLRKLRKNARFFDDLLNDLCGALYGKNGAALAGIVRNRYRAALIDEFQDTDPVQYDIFRKIYDREDTALFIIGDPKQAIYSFRGADIFAYMKASGDVCPQKRFTLTANWRSTPELLTAFNTVFSNEKRPFVYETIEYHPLIPGGCGPETRLTGPPSGPAALHIRCIDPDGETNITKANKLIPAAVAADLSSLLRQGAEGKALIGQRPVMPGDIAVIVRSHRQAGLVRDALMPLGIPCVTKSTQTIFETDESRELCILLQALLEPSNEPKVRAALVTSILGRNGSDIGAILDDEKGWDSCLARFREYHRIWQEKGFMVMSRRIMAEEGIRGRLLQCGNGERRLTNLLHCFEIIHARSHEQNAGMESLVTWFCERVSAKDGTEEHEIRLETDEMAVRILTVHVSKGLEFPVVFCPFLWEGVSEGDDIATFHDGFEMVTDYGSPEHPEHLVLAGKESLAESLRLFYVALTRAKYRCYLYGGRITRRSPGRSPATSPISYLFHASDSSRTAPDPVDALRNEIGRLSADETVERFQGVVSAGCGTLSFSMVDENDEAVPWETSTDDAAPACRTFTGSIRSDWRVSSFTSFSSHETRSPELPDRDESTGEPPDSLQPVMPLPQEGGIFAFPRGSRAGVFIHSIFEELDFSDVSRDSTERLVRSKLETFSFDTKWLPHICGMVDSVVNAPLLSGDGSFTLSCLKMGRWLTELEFFFPLKFLTAEALGASLRRFGYHAADADSIAGSLRFRPVRGMVRGFMDMVLEHEGRYYLVDWKSNHLGNRFEDYGQASLMSEMKRNLYHLQYLLYCVALNRYLSLRVPGYRYSDHFGGVLYLFVRGIGTPHDSASGIFRDLPPAALIDDLTTTLISSDWRGTSHEH